MGGYEHIGVGFSSTRWPISCLIRLLTGQSFSHVWILDTRQNPPLVLEAGFNGITETDWPTFKKGKINIVVKRIESIDMASAVDDSRALLGEEYDFWGLLGGIWLQLGRWLKKKWHNPLARTKSMFCSELVADVLKRARHARAFNCTPDQCEPEDVWYFVMFEPTEDLP